MWTAVGLILLAAYFSTTECWYAFVLVICQPFQRQNWSHNFHWGAASVVEINWWPAGVMRTWVGQLQKSWKKTNKAPLWTKKAQAASSVIFIVLKNILSLWLVGTDKNEQLTLLSQLRLAVTRRNMFMALKIRKDFQKNQTPGATLM